MNSIEYWEKRKAKRMFEYMGLSEDAALEIAKLYRKASMYTTQEMTQIFNRYKTKFGLSEAEARRILNTLKDPNSLDELRKVLRNKELTAERKEALELLEAPAYRARINRFQKLQDNIDSVMKNVYGQEKDFSTGHYIDLGYDAYYKSMFDIQKHVGLGFDFSQLNVRDFDVLLNSNWSGSNYSQRIWENTEELAQRVKEELLVSLLTGRTERETAAIIQDEFNVGAYKARRLIRTESAYVAEEMEAKSYEECGAEKYRFLAVLDLKTSEICRAKDNQVFELSKRKTGVNYPPLHPWCRSTTCIYIDDETLEHMTRIAQDPITGKNIKVPANMSYKEWCKKYVPEELRPDFDFKNEIIQDDNQKKEEFSFGDSVWDELFRQQRENKKNAPAPVNEKVLPDVFKKATSTEEATKFGKLYSKFDDFKVADDVKLEIVNGFNEAAYNVKKKYGRDLEIKGISKMLGTNPNQAAIGKTSKIVELKNNSISVLKKKAIKNFETNWNATDDVYGVFYHEIGHAVWDDLSNNARFEITSIYRKLREETYKEWQMMGGSKSMFKHADVFGMKLSRYGMTNEKEFFSEVFSQIMSGDIAGVSKEVDDILMRSYRKSPLLNTINNVKQMKVDYIDVLHEYLIKKNHSTLSFDANYIKSNHKSEVDTAMWLLEKFGGDIQVLNESKQFNVKTADFLWNGKLWDLKDITTAKAADSAIRKGLKQIESCPGGIILNLSTDEIDIDELLKYVGNRIKRSSKNSIDILIKLNDEIIKLIRYKK